MPDLSAFHAAHGNKGTDGHALEPDYTHVIAGAWEIIEPSTEPLENSGSQFSKGQKKQAIQFGLKRTRVQVFIHAIGALGRFLIYLNYILGQNNYYMVQGSYASTIEEK